MAGKTPRDPNYVQKGFGLKKQISGLLQNDYHSHLVDALRERGHRLVFGDVTIRLAKDFGFCYDCDSHEEQSFRYNKNLPPPPR